MPSPPLHPRAAVALARLDRPPAPCYPVDPARRGRLGGLPDCRTARVPGRGEDHTTMCDLRVMTFNIRGAVHRDGENAWPHRAALNVATIARHAPDLIGFQ